MSMTSMGARQHLLQLEKESLIESFDRAEKVGRPSKYWRLTDAGHGRFPDRYADLTISLINDVKSIFGEQGLERLIDKRERESLSLYQNAVKSRQSLAEKVKVLAELRSNEGYMADVIVNDEPNSFYLVENHCPICAAATECQKFCRSELDIFRKVFGQDVNVNREEHIISGARRCAYRIEKVKRRY